jgi:hypothetical protein
VRRFNAAFFGRRRPSSKENGVETPHSKKVLHFLLSLRGAASRRKKESGVETPHSKRPPAMSQMVRASVLGR